MRAIRLTVLAASISPLAGCAGWMTAAQAEPAAAEVAVFTELGVIQPHAARTNPVRSDGPSLVAGDGLAMQWAYAHGVIAARDAGPWAPAMLVLD